MNATTHQITLKLTVAILVKLEKVGAELGITPGKLVIKRTRDFIKHMSVEEGCEAPNKP